LVGGGVCGRGCARVAAAAAVAAVVAVAAAAEVAVAAAAEVVAGRGGGGGGGRSGGGRGGSPMAAAWSRWQRAAAAVAAAGGSWPDSVELRKLTQTQTQRQGYRSPMATQRGPKLNLFEVCLQQPSHTPSWLTACFLGGCDKNTSACTTLGWGYWVHLENPRGGEFH